MNRIVYILFCSLLVVSTSWAQESKKKKKLPKSFLREDRIWTFEVPIWIPGFRGDFSYGDVSIAAEDGQNPGIPMQPIEPPPPAEPPWGGGNIFNRLFKSSSYLKFFFMTRIAYEKNRFLVQGDMFSGSVGNKLKFRYNDKTVVQANVSTALIRLFAGYSVIKKESVSEKFRYELFAYAGARVHFINISSDLDRLITKLDIHPVWTEPIVGVLNQFTFKRWLLIAQADYGGYLLDSKGSYMVNIVAYYKISNLISTKIGWTDWDITHKDRFKNNDLAVKVHLSGPAIGFTFHF